MELESLSLERDDGSISDEDENWKEDDRVSTKLPSMRITKLKLVNLKSVSNEPDEAMNSESSVRSADSGDDDESGEPAVSENTPESAEKYIENLVGLWKEKHTIEEKILHEHIKDTLLYLQGHFSVKIISRYRTVQPEITRVVNSFVDTEYAEETHSVETEDIVIFLWRELRAKESVPLLKFAEIFVLTSGSAYHLIHKDDRDDEFPTQIARRVLQFNLKTLSSKQLTGPRSSQALTYRVDGGAHLSFWDYLGHFTTSYTMPLRMQSSLFRLPCFQKKYGRPGSVSVTIGEDYLNVHQKMSLKDIAALLLQFSRINRGKETLEYMKNVQEEDDTNFDVFHQVTVVKGKGFVEKHNEMLQKRLQYCLDSNTERVGMLLIHKDLAKWHNANEFALQTKTEGSKRYNTLKVWHGCPPQIEEIFHVIRNQSHSTSSRIDVKTLMLQFHDNSSENPAKVRAPLLELVEGHFQSKTGMSLFRYCGEWLKINNEYMTHLEKEFTEIIHNWHLPSDILFLSWPYSGNDAHDTIKPNDKKEMKRMSVPTTKEKFKNWFWQIFEKTIKFNTPGNDIPARRVTFDEYFRGEEKVGEKAFRLFMRMHCQQAEEHYNEGYILYNDILENKSSGYLLGDRVLVKNVELYDILYYTPEKTYLIHVKEGFGNTTRDACSQIRISADLVFRHIICNNNFDILNEFWETVTNFQTKTKHGGYRSTVKDCYQEFGKKAYQQLFKRKEIIYVLAFRDKRMARKRGLPFLLYPEEKLRSTFSDDADAVKDELLRCMYLKKLQTGKVVVTNKVVTTTIKDAEDEIKLRTKDMARKACNILKQTMSSHKSFIAKMEVVHLFSHFRQFQTPDKRLSLNICSINKSLPGSS